MSERTERDREREREPRSVPRDAHAIMGMLKELGVTEFDPRVVTQLLEFAHRYVSAVLEDARVFAGHAKKKTVEAEDVRLAAAGHAERAFTAPPPRELLLEVTRGKNLAPLPLIKPHCGLRLPPDRFCLSACNYRLARARRPRPAPPAAAPNPTPALNSAPAALKRPPTLVTVSKTQAVSVPKPVFKFSSAGKTNSKPVTIKMEVDSDLKRKREDDDYDVL
ncbi:TBP-associated factor 9 [Arctopsyche grandis]|uniref:TBP-associated factor 9 n=1 Tax=Arctopsyche grandis TaxID=121162 RepID=UPI00406D7532